MNTYAERALELAKSGLTPIPLNGKRPVLDGWQKLRQITPEQITDWDSKGLWQNIGLVCGEASKNLVVIDFDGLVGYELFKAQFPDLTQTLTVATGSGKGMHVYLKTELLPDSGKVMDIPLDGGELVNVEWKSNGTQVVIPPSIHPDTKRPYVKHISAPIKQVKDLSAVIAWARSLKADAQPWKPPVTYTSEKNLNRALLREIHTRLEATGYKQHGDWINCSCPNGAAHKHGDKTYSFGFNTVDGGANCYRCGGMSLKVLCSHMGINPSDYGGIYEKQDMQVLPATPPYGGFARTIPGQVVIAAPSIPVVKRSDRLTHYIDRLTDFDTPRTLAPVPFPLKALHKFGGMARVIKPGKLIGIVGVSGGGKTSLLETMVDTWLGYHVPCLVWSPEWNADEFIERAVQRYGGPKTDELYMHEIFVYEQQQGITGGAGVELPQNKIDAASRAIAKLRTFREEVGYLDCPFLTSNYLQSSIDATLKSVDFKPRVLIIDYVQLLYAMDTDPNLTMYNLLMRLKAICVAYNLVGVLATQVTKDSARNQANGNVLDSLAARYVNDDAFNLFITINPDRDEETGAFLPSAVLNIAKNSVGERGKMRVQVDWGRLAFDDKPHMNQVFGKES